MFSSLPEHACTLTLTYCYEYSLEAKETMRVEEVSLQDLIRSKAAKQNKKVGQAFCTLFLSPSILCSPFSVILNLVEHGRLSLIIVTPSPGFSHFLGNYSNNT